MHNDMQNDPLPSIIFMLVQIWLLAREHFYFTTCSASPALFAFFFSHDFPFLSAHYERIHRESREPRIDVRGSKRARRWICLRAGP